MASHTTLPTASPTLKGVQIKFCYGYCWAHVYVYAAQKGT